MTHGYDTLITLQIGLSDRYLEERKQFALELHVILLCMSNECCHTGFVFTVA